MGVCYIETKNLDGETNLKQKNAQKDVIRAFSRTEAILVRITTLNFFVINKIG